MYIAAAPEKVWAALTSSDFTARDLFERSDESDWMKGAPWSLWTPDGRIEVRGDVQDSDPPLRLVMSWNVDGTGPLPECIVSCEIVPVGDDLVRLTITEAHPTPIPAHSLEGGRQGWPMTLSGPNTLLETGSPLCLPIPRPPKSPR